VVLRPRTLLLGSLGLGCSAFARHYLRNHGCFLFLRVLRWFTSPGSLRRPMDSDGDDRRSRRPGSPIRTSPDHSLFAAPRGFSQLTTSFFACLRLGIPTHALSSLTIKSIACAIVALPRRISSARRVLVVCPSIFCFQRTLAPRCPRLALAPPSAPCSLTTGHCQPESPGGPG
jgi:hypothetical protein